MNWDETYAAVYRKSKNALMAVKLCDIDVVNLDDLININEQKEKLLNNTINFINDNGANHALLWGERGCGKSSLVKAVFWKLKDKNLRIIELNKADLENLVDIIDDIRNEKYKFIIFCDDFSFENSDDSYKFLKPVLEGSIQKAPKNVIIYATSNRRHLVSEQKSDNNDVYVTSGELHYGDSVDEKISLSDRFGLWISFYQGSYDEYINIVKHYFLGYKYDEEELIKNAKSFAMLKGSRSGRTAKQFFIEYKNLLESKV
ncbi:MAG: ATP-binding protein [Campylobacter sputorum]|uniref:ATP-binding protein n=1 Tax=Campylobacter sputorum TaxID=206 RepID=UPI000B778F07|nr:ATP-binding protein [Campylobacter sputorum]ASM38332.1 ATPase (AAA+ superfamily, DUF815 domain) [Campylobacter sputorum bv. paraureolyticus LMG 11764]MDY6119754.1 ATP-binding protein [Campylobacter sputorum]